MFRVLFSKGIGDITNNFYWTSSQYDDNIAWITGRSYGMGDLSKRYKNVVYPVRAIRQF